MNIMCNKANAHLINIYNFFSYTCVLVVHLEFVWFFGFGVGQKYLIIVDSIISLYLTVTTSSKGERPETPKRGKWPVA